MNDQPPAEQVAALLAELFDKVITSEDILRHRRISRGLRPALITEVVPHTTREPGLLTQLGVGRDDNGKFVAGQSVPGGSPGWDEDGALSVSRGGKVAEREPVTDAWHVKAEIEAELKELEAEASEAGHTGLVSAAAADEDLGRDLARALRRMVSRARIAASYDAPIVSLRDTYCPDCGGQLRVRADASSGVWCAGMLPVEGPPVDGGEQPIGHRRCPRSWSQGGWVKLLDHAGTVEGRVR